MKAAYAILLLATTLSPPASTAAARGTPTNSVCPASPRLARLVAEADLVVVASPAVPEDQLRSAMGRPTGDRGYIDIPLGRVTILRGQADPAGLVVKFYPGNTAYMPSPEAVLARAGQPTLLFVTRVDEGPSGLYLARSVDALQPASRLQVEAVQAEVRRQRLIASRWVAEPTLPHFARVRELVSNLPSASQERQEQIFQQLEALGSAAVPAIVAQMDDRRPLAHQQISLVNDNSDAFEGLRHYDPKLIVDALDAILNQVVGLGGSIANGGSERERRSAVEMWRVHAADLQCGVR